MGHGLALAVSLAQAGRGMTLLGLVFGAGSYWASHGNRPPGGPILRARLQIDRATAIPFLLVGAVGAVLWIVASLA